MFPRYSREQDALPGLVREFSEAFSLGEEPLTVSHRLNHEIRFEGTPVYEKPYLLL